MGANNTIFNNTIYNNITYNNTGTYPSTNIFDLNTKCYDDTYVKVSIGGIVIFLHLVGLFLMANNTSKQMFVINQTFLIRFLSITETVFIILKIIEECGNNEDEIYVLVSSFIYSALFNHLLIMSMMLVDRLLITYLNIKYNTYIRSKYVKIVGFMVFLLTLIPVGISIYFHYEGTFGETLNFVVLIALMLVILVIIYPFLALFVYTYIFVSTKILTKKLNAGRTNANIGKFLRIPLLIIASFLIFIIMPYIISNYGKFTGCMYDFEVYCYKFSFISDALIYIFLTPRCSKKLETSWKAMKSKFIKQNDTSVRYKNNITCDTSI